MIQLKPNDWYKLIQDQDSHWYVIPVKLEDKFNEWVKTIAHNDAIAYLKIKRQVDFNQFRLHSHITCYQFTGWKYQL